MNTDSQDTKVSGFFAQHKKTPLQTLILYKLLLWEDNSETVSAMSLLLTLKLHLKFDPAPFQALGNLPFTCVGARLSHNGGYSDRRWKS